MILWIHPCSVPLAAVVFHARQRPRYKSPGLSIAHKLLDLLIPSRLPPQVVAVWIRSKIVEAGSILHRNWSSSVYLVLLVLSSPHGMIDDCYFGDNQVPPLVVDSVVAVMVVRRGWLGDESVSSMSYV